ncbi:MAG: hypothetical protein INQ03_00805 [Candidatus Heimdallarchaeota archaeon]|nr:hypothetical protein [Candidatus Heimdallarchaeota archaeon]
MKVYLVGIFLLLILSESTAIPSGNSEPNVMQEENTIDMRYISSFELLDVYDEIWPNASYKIRMYSQPFSRISGYLNNRGQILEGYSVKSTTIDILFPWGDTYIDEKLNNEHQDQQVLFSGGIWSDITSTIPEPSGSGNLSITITIDVDLTYNTADEITSIPSILVIDFHKEISWNFDLIQNTKNIFKTYVLPPILLFIILTIFLKIRAMKRKNNADTTDPQTSLAELESLMVKDTLDNLFIAKKPRHLIDDHEIANYYKNEANTYTNRGNYRLALSYCNKYLELEHTNVPMLFNKANLLIRLQYLPEAFELLEYILLLDPTHILSVKSKHKVMGLAKTRGIHLLTDKTISQITQRLQKISFRDLGLRLNATEQQVQQYIREFMDNERFVYDDTHIWTVRVEKEEVTTGEPCAICRSDKYSKSNREVICIHCEYHFHYFEFFKWVRESDTCPVCRRYVDLRYYQKVTSEE